MTLRTTLSCNQPGCTVELSGSADELDWRLRHSKWTTERVNGEQFHTCPNHQPGAPTHEHRLMAQAGAQMLAELKDLNSRGYYVTSCSHHGESTTEEQAHIGDGCVLHLYLLENEYPTGPYVQIIQQGHSIHARLRADDGAETVVLDEWAGVWDG